MQTMSKTTAEAAADPCHHPARHDPEKPALVLLHGMFGRPDDWLEVCRGLQGQWRITMPNLPVFDFPLGKCGLENLCDWLRQHLDDHGFERVVLAGNSLGGQLALLTALDLPERVAGLVLTGSSGLHERGFERGVPRRPDREWIRNRVSEVFYNPIHVTEELLDEVAETIRNPRTVLNIVRLARAVKRGNLRDQLPRIQCPVTLIWGTEDQITPPDVAHDFAAHLPNCELHFIERCGHAPPIERPAEFLEIFRHSLERLVA
jgi:pimeloyl-ACP methyl ester carboxylesterase